ncbi:DUF2750 domain-containing protein [Actinopolymorpha pittospori]|uniref:DUF2750 domain-containing protein n=1 Tax=Actinopolymorpha pittospori TaxID=648752 RepID=A0A927MRR7_9ACTN|nr:DUF2750 domain-containing protein [Actinopolymorpha pittospori]MBE1605690.1 hypothetical protein [Actinopolymorpha pittospori]
MSVAAAQASAFYEEFLTNGQVFALRDDAGFPAPLNSEGVRAMPFWSKRSRAEKIIANVPAYSGMEPVEIPGQDWLEKWLPGLEKDGLLVGLNWSGVRAIGYDLTVADVQRNLDARRRLRSARHHPNAE